MVHQDVEVDQRERISVFNFSRHSERRPLSPIAWKLSPAALVESPQVLYHFKKWSSVLVSCCESALLHAVKDPCHVECCYWEVLVYVVWTSEKGVEESDVVMAVADDRSSDGEMGGQLFIAEDDIKVLCNESNLYYLELAGYVLLGPSDIVIACLPPRMSFGVIDCPISLAGGCKTDGYL